MSSGGPSVSLYSDSTSEHDFSENVLPIPEGTARPEPDGIHITWGLSYYGDKCTLSTFFRYSSFPCFVLVVNGKDDEERERNEILVVGVDLTESTLDDVNESCTGWVDSLAKVRTDGPRVRVACADVERMRVLGRWSKIKPFMDSLKPEN